MAIRWEGLLRLCPIKRGALRKGGSIFIEKKMHKAKWFGDTTVTTAEGGKILSIKGTKTHIHILAKFKYKKKEAPITKAKFLKMFFETVDFNKKHLEKLFTKILYYNLTEEDLKKILKQGIVFKRPKAFTYTEAGERLYLKSRGKYYEV